MCREADPIHGHIFLLYQSCGRGVFKAAKCLAMQVLIPKYGYKGVVAKTLAAPHTAHCKLFHKVCLRVNAGSHHCFICGNKANQTYMLRITLESN